MGPQVLVAPEGVQPPQRSGHRPVLRTVPLWPPATLPRPLPSWSHRWCNLCPQYSPEGSPCSSRSAWVFGISEKCPLPSWPHSTDATTDPPGKAAARARHCACRHDCHMQVTSGREGGVGGGPGSPLSLCLLTDGCLGGTSGGGSTLCLLVQWPVSGPVLTFSITSALRRRGQASLESERPPGPLGHGHSGCDSQQSP